MDNKKILWISAGYSDLAVDRNTAEAGKKRIKEFYAKYYGNYIAINKMTIMRITIVLFYKAYRLWELSVGKLYFAPKYK
ncbi:hypothetical protein [Butyrivibrio fibrisolvens]|uniref:hypothetical protein n=1 Tax=Butyrivibrio fibrisolvens TaxID=831 RepID=UPI0003B70128|nr:hypothetical protein [Butyrivibrio fibrisolvens]